MKEKKGRTRDINALATVEGNKGGWTLIFYAAAGGQADVVSFMSILKTRDRSFAFNPSALCIDCATALLFGR